MSDEKPALFLGNGGRAAPIWINVGLTAVIVATTGAGVYQFSTIEHSISRANSSLDSVSQTVSKIETQLSAQAGAITSASSGLAVLRARVEAFDARMMRCEATTERIESRVRDLENRK